MDNDIQRALAHSQIADITTTGRHTRLPRRIEIYLHALDEGLFISGMPRREKRAWLLNLEADPRLTLHLKRGIDADVDGSARVVTEEPERRRILEKIARAWGRADIDAMDRFSPLIEVRVDAARTGRAAA